MLPNQFSLYNTFVTIVALHHCLSMYALENPKSFAPKEWYLIQVNNRLTAVFLGMFWERKYLYLCILI